MYDIVTCLFIYLYLISVCDPAVNCSGSGSCNATGSCECSANYFGPHCETGNTFFIFLFLRFILTNLLQNAMLQLIVPATEVAIPLANANVMETSLEGRAILA